MRFELGGTMVPSGPSGPGNPTNPPRLVLTYTADGTFSGADYQDAGYTNYDVLCIGAGGGGGGAIDKYIDVVNGRLTTLYDNGNITEHTYTKCTGGAGGGGGIQIVSGLLAALPDSCPIVV